MSLKWKLNRVRIIEAISIAAGLATLLSAAQSIALRVPRNLESKINSLSNSSRTRALEMPHGFNVHRVLVAELLGEPSLSDGQFSAFISAETSFMKDLPPLVEQLHKDMKLLEQLKSDLKLSKNDALLAQLKKTIVNDKEAIVRRMQDDREALSQIVSPDQQAHINRLSTSG